MSGRFKVGDRVGVTAETRERLEAQAKRANWPCGPLYGHVVNVGAQSLVWVRSADGGEWGLPEHQLEHID
jgi:hypothetical protein